MKTEQDARRRATILQRTLLIWLPLVGMHLAYTIPAVISLIRVPGHHNPMLIALLPVLLPWLLIPPVGFIIGRGVPGFVIVTSILNYITYFFLLWWLVSAFTRKPEPPE